MDVNERDVFEEFAQNATLDENVSGQANENGAPMGATNEENTDMNGTNEVPMYEGNEEKPSAEIPTVAVLPQGEPAKVVLPFPPKDYNKKGELKKVRGRMLKKLLKAEWKHYLPFTLGFMGLLLLTGIFCGIGLRSMDLANEPTANVIMPDTLSITSILLFAGRAVGAVVFAAAYPIARYEKNFFQNEGYLTFSIPASMEEHVAAKRIAAVIVSYAMSVVLVLAVFLAVLISGDMNWEGPVSEGIFTMVNEVYLTGGHAVVYILESLLSAMIGGVMMPSLYAVLTCLLSKSSGKRKTGTTIILVFIGVAILDSISATFLSVEAILPQTVAWAHISAWLGIVAQIAVTIACICLEIWYLKKKLDLK